MLPPEVVARLLQERQVLGLLMKIGSEARTFFFLVNTVEQPDNLAEFNLGAASALSSTGTSWDEVQDTGSRYYLEPSVQNVIYQTFFGVSPAQARVYRRYPTDQDMNSLVTTRNVGDPVGFVDGWLSPFRRPSVQTEMWTLNGAHPAFNGYHPYAAPSSINVLLNLFVTRYDVTYMGVDPSGDGGLDRRRRIAEQAVRDNAILRTVGGRSLIPAPQWLLATSEAVAGVRGGR